MSYLLGKLCPLHQFILLSHRAGFLMVGGLKKKLISDQLIVTLMLHKSTLNYCRARKFCQGKLAILFSFCSCLCSELEIISWSLGHLAHPSPQLKYLRTCQAKNMLEYVQGAAVITD